MDWFGIFREEHEVVSVMSRKYTLEDAVKYFDELCETLCKEDDVVRVDFVDYNFEVLREGRTINYWIGGVQDLTRR